MKNVIKWFGLAVLVTAIVFAMSACDSGGGSGGGGGGTGGNENGGNGGNGGTVSTDTVTLTSNSIAKHDGYDYEFWTDSRGAGSGKMVLTGGGSFTCEWTDTYNILFRMGKKYNRTQTHSQIGTFALEYGFSDYAPVGTSYVTVYGWTVDPLVEFYIVENWGPNNYRGGGQEHERKATVTIGGHVYDIYETTRTNQPSIEGTQTFKQYWSIRQTRRTSGTIPISEHFQAWADADLDMSGKMYEVAFCIEAFGGDSRNASGKANVHTNKLTVNGVEINK